MRIAAILFTALFSSLQAWALPAGEFEIMAPLTIGDVNNPEAPESAPAWEAFRLMVREAKQDGFTAVHADIWWGLVNPQDGDFNFAYYVKMAKILKEEQMAWKPILSTHQLGGNVGDTGSIGIPPWVFKKYIGQPGVADENSLKSKSEQGNVNSETVSPWGTRFVLQDYARFFEAFQTQFAGYAPIIKGIALSFGPAGELRYPSYNIHDKETGYGTRGALQSYSDLAIASFRAFVKEKYQGDVARMNAAWGDSLKSFDEVYVPNPAQVGDWFAGNGQHSAYGKDFFFWYNKSLLDHAEMISKAAFHAFNRPGAAFKGIRLAGKIPSLHWLAAINRLPELAAGLIHTAFADWNADEVGHGYQPMLDLFKRLNDMQDSPGFEAHYTAIEMDDGRDGEQIGSLAKSLVGWISDYSKHIGLFLKGENALASEINNEHARENIYSALTDKVYAGITLLRLNSYLENPDTRAGFRSLIKRIHQRDCDAELKGQ